MKVQPFFARYLETQKPGVAVTMRYPSDGEDAGSAPSTMVTMRYPSDSEDAGVDTVLKRPSDMGKVLHPGTEAGRIQTLKYPSDNEDAGSCPGTGCDNKPPVKEQDMLQKLLAQIMKLFGLGGADTGKPGQVTTMKFPSDSDSVF